MNHEEGRYPSTAVDPLVREVGTESGELRAVVGAGSVDRARAVSTDALPRWARAARIGLLALVDASALSVAGMLVVVFWAIGVRNQSPATYAELLPLLGLFTLAYAKAGLYPGFGLGAVETLRRLVLWTGFVFLILATASFAFKLPPLYSRVSFVLALLLSLGLLPIFRMLLLRAMSGVNWWTEPVVVIGTGRLAARSIRTLQRALSLGYRPRWVLAGADDGPAPTSVAGVPVVGHEDDAELLSGKARVALVAREGVDESSELVEHLQRDFRHVILIRHSRGAQIEGVVPRNLGAVLGLELTNRLLLRRNRLIKRCLDLAIAVPAVILSLPAIAVAALAIKLVSPGPSFFRQERVGYHGRPVGVTKLRTMVVGAEELLSQHLANDIEARREWAEGYKLRKDPRLVPVLGPLLRRYSIDELPQLWSVVKGEMSLVGPRPFPEYHLAGFSDRFRRLRCRARPGVTGLWQVMVRSAGGMREQEYFDSYYIRNWSLWLDLYILARTILAVLGGRGAH